MSGGSGEIGAAICRALASAGWEVVVHARSHPERAAALAAEIAAAGGKAQSIAFDVVDAAATTTALATLLQAGPIQGVVHNARHPR